MQLLCSFVIALWLILPAAGRGFQAQDPASPANASEPARSPVSEENTKAAPASPQAPVDEKTAPENAAKQTPAPAPLNATKKRHKHLAPVQGAPRKIVVREGGASEPLAQIAPGITPAEATREHQQAARLLSSTEDRLKQLAGRTLDIRQQETVGQIHNYLDGARLALKEGDVGRANTLAEKAHLLAEDLVKH
jgi:hypothetical protein